MGCDYYGKLHFNENSNVGCLCTFPHNDRAAGKELTADRVRSLAYLGAAVVLEHQGELESPFMPDCLPEWIRKEIDRNLGISG